ncbi:MAG: nitrous oxide-stimulated promoter family protein [Arcobacteraceae bacterium]
MTSKKFQTELRTLQKFITLYCKEKHSLQRTYTQNIIYKQDTFDFEVCLCSECRTIFEYSLSKLQQCPQEIKPRCRSCPTPCYEKAQWKYLAKIMRFSGLHLGVLKMKSFFRFHN